MIGTLWRSWFLAVDRPRDAAGGPLPHSAAALVPLLLLVALIGQSLAESRLLIESGWLLLIAIAWSTKRRQWEAEPLPAGSAAGARVPDAAARGDPMTLGRVGVRARRDRTGGWR